MRSSPEDFIIIFTTLIVVDYKGEKKEKEKKNKQERGVMRRDRNKDANKGGGKTYKDLRRAVKIEESLHNREHKVFGGWFVEKSNQLSQTNQSVESEWWTTRTHYLQTREEGSK
jgi:hypothetical protein